MTLYAKMHVLIPDAKSPGLSVGRLAGYQLSANIACQIVPVITSVASPGTVV